jgi:hypothetical protein
MKNTSMLEDVITTYGRVTWKVTHLKVLTMLCQGGPELREEFFTWFSEKQEKRRQIAIEREKLRIKESEDHGRAFKIITENLDLTDEQIAEKIGPVFHASSGTSELWRPKAVQFRRSLAETVNRRK